VEVDATGLLSGAQCVVVLTIEGVEVEIPARVGSITAGHIAVLFGDLPEQVTQLAELLRAAPAVEAAPVVEVAAIAVEEEAGGGRSTLSERLRELTATQKMQLALAGGREERMALLRDVNRTLHGYVLRNPRIGIDEVLQAAKLTSLAPDALQLIADHPEWSRNATVCTAVVKNAKTPIAIAVRLLDRISDGDVRLIAKGAGRAQLVAAARRKLNL